MLHSCRLCQLSCTIKFKLFLHKFLSSFEIWSSLPICWLTAHLRKIKVFVLHVPWTIIVNWKTEKARRFFFDEMTLQNCINNVDKIVMIMSILADHSWIDQMFPTRCTNFNSTHPIIRMDILCYSQSHQKSNFCYTISSYNFFFRFIQCNFFLFL